MFCPSCNTFMLEDQLIKTNVKKSQDAIMEYDARCPFCRIKIGKMSWGKLIVAEGLAPRRLAPILDDPCQQQEYPIPQQDNSLQQEDVPSQRQENAPAHQDASGQPHPQEEENAGPEPDETPPPASSFGKYDCHGEEEYPFYPPSYPPPSYYYCPHCGRPLPEDKYRIPYKPGFNENA